jgi:hypothetical protein
MVGSAGGGDEQALRKIRLTQLRIINPSPARNVTVCAAAVEILRYWFERNPDRLPCVLSLSEAFEELY